MPETTRFKFARKNVHINNTLATAQSRLFQLYYQYLREHPDLAEYLEVMLLKVEDVRADLRDFQITCWEYAPQEFDDVGQMDALIIEARHDVLGEEKGCRGYLRDWVRSECALSNLLSRLAEPSPKPSDLYGPSPQTSQSPPSSENGVTSPDPKRPNPQS